MIVLRNKTFSLFKSIKNLFSAGKTQKEVMDQSNSRKQNVLYRDITFREGYEKSYWPALVVLHIKSAENKHNGGWEEMADWMLRNKFFEKGGTLTEIHPLSYKDNVNGKNGASAVVLVFSKDTKISSYTRLLYGQNFKWPEDFFCSYNNYYTWYKSGKELIENSKGN